MPVKIIVSYDGTANEDDAIALGRVFARAGADVGLAYVRHTSEPDRDSETLVQHEAEALLERGDLLGHGGLRVGERVGRRRQRPAVGDLFEDSQATDVEHKQSLYIKSRRSLDLMSEG